MVVSKLKNDGLIFDLDGTLWDSTAACADAWNDALVRLRLEAQAFSAKDVEKIMGMPHKKVFETLFPQHQEETREKIATEFYEREIEAVQGEGAFLYPGVEEGLRNLHQHFPLYLVSNCQPDYLQVFLELTRFHSLFKDMECHGNTGLSKAENIKRVVERNGLKRAVYIGDTSGDHDSANQAGIGYVHVNYGFGRSLGPCQSFDSFSELVRYFLA